MEKKCRNQLGTRTTKNNYLPLSSSVEILYSSVCYLVTLTDLLTKKTKAEMLIFLNKLAITIYTIYLCLYVDIKP